MGKIVLAGILDLPDLFFKKILVWFLQPGLIHTMGAWSYSCLFVLSVLCLLDGQVASIAPEVCAWIVTPEADRKAGGELEMRCLATDLESNHLVEWSDRPPDQVTYDHHLLTSSDEIGRYHFHTEQTGTTLTKYFIIHDLRAEDTGEYFCNICEVTDGLKLLLSTSSVAVSVLYFPSAPFPVCSPAGPITVDPGTELNLRCSSDSGNSAVTMEVTQTPTRCARYSWTSCSINDTVSAAALTLTVGLADDGTAFECNISSVYFPGGRRSCTIGPIRVTGAPGAATEYTPAGLPEVTSSSPASGSFTEPTTPVIDQSKPDDDVDDKEDDDAAATAAKDDDDNEDDEDNGPAQDDSDTEKPKTCPHPKTQPSHVPWMAAFLVTLLLLVVSIVLNVLLLLRNWIPKRMNNNKLVARRHQPPEPEPEMELQDIETNVQQQPKQPEENSYEETEN
ncbi:uncharacterized protein LOC119732596 [Patiria miniata]|uniref:Ig-like domain-containing protein n=1 Tax=Patiria miniata TaxID=46514 RepID=A0A914AFE6_PATMI|nr:uncharacterized protein LOC119732596 [Patiria miniata]